MSIPEGIWIELKELDSKLLSRLENKASSANSQIGLNLYYYIFKSATQTINNLLIAQVHFTLLSASLLPFT